MFDYLIDFLQTERKASLVGFISAHCKQSSQEAYQVVNMEFVSFAHELVDVPLKQIAFVIDKGNCDVSAACVLIFAYCL